MIVICALLSSLRMVSAAVTKDYQTVAEAFKRTTIFATYGFRRSYSRDAIAHNHKITPTSQQQGLNVSHLQYKPS